MASQLTTGFHRFLLWWTSELKALLPRRSRGVYHRSGPRLVLCAAGNNSRVILEKNGQNETLAETGENAVSELASIAKSRPKLPVGLRFNSQNCFARILELPAQAEGDFARILELDMERTTPFRSVDVWSAYHLMPGAPRGKQAVQHLIIKKKTLGTLLDEMRGLGIEPDFADCWDDEGRSGLPVNFLAGAETSKTQGRFRPVPVMATLAILMCLSAALALIVRHEAALETLQTRTAAARTEAESVRRAVAASETASAQIAAISGLIEDRLSAAQIIEELTGLIPDDAWLSSLNIEGNVIEMTGFAKSAAALVPILEKSQLFADVSLTAPVIFDNEANNERFGLRLRLSESPAPAQVRTQASAEKATKL